LERVGGIKVFLRRLVRKLVAGDGSRESRLAHSLDVVAVIIKAIDMVVNIRGITDAMIAVIAPILAV
jgi:hypothetical protein